MKFEKVQEKIVGFVTRLQENKVIKLVSTSMTGLMPVLMLGAVCSLISGLPFGDGYKAFLDHSGLSALMSAGTTITQLMAVWAALSIGAGVADMWGQDRTTCSMIGLLAFLLCTPLTTSVTAQSGEVIMVSGVLSTGLLGSQGMFAAMIVSGLAAAGYCLLMSKNLKIRLPESVPPFVSKSFEAIIPGILVGVVCLAIRGIFEATSYGSLNQAIYSMIQSPLSRLGGTLPAMLIFIFLTSLLWWFGLHGTLVVIGFVNALYYPQMMTNLEAFMAGAPLSPSGVVVLTYLFWFLFIQFFGGPGMLFGLDVNMVLFAKSERYRALGKLAIVPGFFNIIEPVVYGFPIVMNPVMVIPFCVGPVVFATVGYFLMTSGIIGYPVAMMAVMTLPGPVVGFLLGGGISLGIFCVICVALSVVMYYPFFKIADNLAVKEEQAQQNA